MSQKKVEAYKEYKKNREKIYAKERRSRLLELSLLVLIAVVLLGWLGFSVYRSATRPAEGEAQATVIDAEAYNEYVNDLETGYDG